MLSLFAKENARLQRQLQDVMRRLAAAEGKSEAEQLQLSELREQVAKFKRSLFGDSSEKRPRDEKPKSDKEPQRGHGRREQSALKKRDVVMDLPEEDRDCPSCGKRLEPMKGVTEDSDLIASSERAYWEIHSMRQRYRCGCDGAIVTAPGPDKVVAGGRNTLQFAVQVGVDKYTDHLPLARQVRIMKRAGLVVDAFVSGRDRLCGAEAGRREHRPRIRDALAVASEALTAPPTCPRRGRGRG